MGFDLTKLDLSLVPFVGGIIVVVMLGFGVGPLLNYWTAPARPEDEPSWPDVRAAGRAIGLLESLLFFVSIVVGYPVFIGAWLVFKVAAKWEAWGNIVRLPELPQANLNSDSFRERWKFSTWLHSRSLLGTLLNVAIAGIGSWVYLQVLKYCGTD